MERKAVAKVEKMRTGNNRPHRQSARSSSAGHQLLELQRAVGNQAIQRLTSSPFIQEKLQISTPEDESEQEADRVAVSVMRMPEPAVSREAVVQPVSAHITPLAQRETDRPDDEDEIVAPKSKSPIPVAVREDDEEEKPLVQRACAECEEEKKQDQGQAGGMVHRESGDHIATPKVTNSVAANIHAMNGGGSPLPATTRAFFEPRFGADFSQVRVHTDSRAAATANSIQARAFTVGRNIAFGTGQYAPHTSAGRRLLAHELTHVVQREAGDVIQRRPSPQLVKAKKRDAWLKELAMEPHKAHREWKRLTNMERVAVMVQMNKRYGHDFAKEFLRLTKQPIKSSSQHLGPGFPEHTPDWFQSRGYRLSKRSSVNEFWVDPKGNTIIKVLDQARTPEIEEPPIEDCTALADVTLSILRDTISLENSVKKDLEETKSRLEKMDKTTDDYCQQYDAYISSLTAMKARLKTAAADIEILRKQLEQQKCNESQIDSLLQELADLEIWADIESSPMGTQFLECLKVRGPKDL